MAVNPEVKINTEWSCGVFDLRVPCIFLLMKLIANKILDGVQSERKVVFFPQPESPLPPPLTCSLRMPYTAEVGHFELFISVCFLMLSWESMSYTFAVWIQRQEGNGNPRSILKILGFWNCERQNARFAQWTNNSSSFFNVHVLPKYKYRGCLWLKHFTLQAACSLSPPIPAASDLVKQVWYNASQPGEGGSFSSNCLLLSEQRHIGSH